MTPPRNTHRRRAFTLIEVALAILVFAVSLAALLGMLGSARSRILRSQRKWARGHLLSSSVEFHLLAGDMDSVPPGVLPEGFRAECTVEEPAGLPEEAELEIGGWRLAVYDIRLYDPMGERIASKRVRKVVPEQR
jgi:prepilin-type N-terminal cleavage/methylation domain-containing protein